MYGILLKTTDPGRRKIGGSAREGLDRQGRPRPVHGHEDPAGRHGRPGLRGHLLHALRRGRHADGEHLLGHAPRPCRDAREPVRGPAPVPGERRGSACLHPHARTGRPRTSPTSRSAARCSSPMRKGTAHTAVIGRTKIERRPLLLVEAEAGKAKVSLILQNAETIRLVGEDGKAISVVNLADRRHDHGLRARRRQAFRDGRQRDYPREVIMKAGIIGGTGRMGRLFVPVFERAGTRCSSPGRTTALTNAELARAVRPRHRLGPHPRHGQGDRRDRPAPAPRTSSSAISRRSR